MIFPHIPDHDGIVDAVHTGPETNPSTHIDGSELTYHWSTDAAREDFLQDLYSGEDIPL